MQLLHEAPARSVTEARLVTVHPQILEIRHHRWPDETACAAAAEALAAKPGLWQAFVALHGDLGAGKTTFVRHLLRALGATGRIKSPTFAVMEPYSLPGGCAAHFDFYRFEAEGEWADAGFRDVFAAPGLKLAEWPERAGPALPTPDLALHIHLPAETSASAEAAALREVTLHAHTPLGQALLW
jgi:tRNA threonylcarbamoyladenosine biosynthesis protein TsaE